MITTFGRQRSEGGLDTRLAELSARRTRGPNIEQGAAADDPGVDNPVIQEEMLLDERLAIARKELIARLGAEIRPERRSLMSRQDFAKLVDAVVQAYLVRHSLPVTPLQRSGLVTEIVQILLAPPRVGPPSQRDGNTAAIETAMALIPRLVLERLDITSTSEVPRPALEAQLASLVPGLLTENEIHLSPTEQAEVIKLLLADMLGLGPLEPLIGDDTVTDIMVNGPKQVCVERRGGVELTRVTFRDDQHLMTICTRIVTRLGRHIDESQPLVVGRLFDGSLVKIMMPPLTLDDPAISIRKLPRRTVTLDSIATQGGMSSAMATLLKIAVRCRLNILISGGRGSGKTTLLGAMTGMFDRNERVVTIEGSPELQVLTPCVLRLVPYGEMTPRDLLHDALPWGWDRIIIGEWPGAEALDLLSGSDGFMTTIGALNPRDALLRLEWVPGLSIPPQSLRARIASAINLVCQIDRMRDGIRRVTRITEIIGVEGDAIITQDLFKYGFQGDGADGLLRGTFDSCGVRPAFLPRAEYYGLDRAVLEVVER
jgi:pilus assembly protein CpaF